jgi:hypothetical protein
LFDPMPPNNCKAGSSRTEYLSGMSVPTAALAVGSPKSSHFADNRAFDF